MKPGFDYIGITTPFYCHDGKGNFLLHKRSDQCRDEQGNWDPGSEQLDFGVSLEENVLREVREEYGCQGVINEMLPAHDIFRDQKNMKTHWLAVPFFVQVKPEEVINNEPHKIVELGWFRLDNLPNPIHSGFLYTFERYKERFEYYAKLKE